MNFEPIAIVGRGCVLPDALDPGALWRNVADGRDSLRGAPPGRWRLPPGAVRGTPDECVDRTWSDVGGYVEGFEAVFDPTGFRLEADQILRLDPLFQWVLHGARAALREAGQEDAAPRAGLVLGNLSFPSEAMTEYAEHVWLGSRPAGLGPAPAWPPAARPDPRNRFMSGLPAHLAARALGLGAGAFALDSACASSLFAIKLGCDQLHDRSADLMLAGAVNRADDLFIHIGFCALSALSRSGQSRPFHREADGLVPAEGAAFVALMRLADALAADRPVLGVIRGIGLSNDGRGAGLLVPAEEGQLRAMRQAYRLAGVAPESVSLVECHATGTLVGDAVEAASLRRVFADCADLPIGSVKSNLGHPVTAAGVTGLLKVLGAMDAGIRPASRHADQPIAELAGTPLRLLAESEEWPDGPRRAAVDAFGFGGNNAHLIVDSWPPASPALPVLPVRPRQQRPAGTGSTEAVAIVAIGARVGNGRDAHDFRRALFAGRSQPAPRETIEIALDGLRFPPLDLQRTHAQQLLVLEAAREAARGVQLPRERTMVVIGMGCDPDVARYGPRWRVSSWLGAGIAASDPAAVDRLREAFAPALSAAAVVGTMPNIVANRLNVQLDLAGPSFSVSAEEASGLVALRLAARALRAGEVDAALVGAVDLSHQAVHLAALAELGHHRTPGDAAVVLVLKRCSDARRDGDQVVAVLDPDTPEPADLVFGEHGVDLAALFGAPHAAEGLLAVAGAALALRHQAVPRVGAPADPALGARTAQVRVSALEAGPFEVRLRADTAAPWVAERPPRLHVYSGTDTAQALAALDAGRESDPGPARLVVLAADQAQLTERAEAARRWLLRGAAKPDGVAFRERPLTGEVGFVFTGGMAAYPGMGRELLLAFPDLIERLERRSGPLRRVAGWAYAGPRSRPGHVLDQVWGTALLSQLHALITQDVLGLAPRAALGYSAGESNALVALGAWTDMAGLVEQMTASEVFTRDVVGEYRAIRRAWSRAGIAGTRWANYLVGAPVGRIRAAIGGDPAVHVIAVNSPDSCVVGGEVAGCERLLARLDSTYALRIPYDLAVHAPEVEEVRAEWWRLHHRPTTPVPGVRFYTCAGADWYTVTAQAAADALTDQAVQTMDFAGVVERAWADGVRVFVEHGPKALCSDWIRRTLGDREHLALALDAPDGRSIRQLTQVVAELVAAGVDVNATALFDHLDATWPTAGQAGPVISIAAHQPAVELSLLGLPAQQMARPPVLPPVLEMLSGSGAGPGHRPARSATAVPVVPPVPAVPAVPAVPRHEVAAAGPATWPAATAAELVVARRAMTPAGSSAFDHHRRVAATHALFVREQAAAQQAMLRLQQQTNAALLRGLSGMPSQHPTTPAPNGLLPVPASAGLPGPKFNRADLEHLASGRISDLFGPLFAGQDGYLRQTRMPTSPMLLADRVTGIDAVAGSMGTGTIWTETDVQPDGWYLDSTGRMAPGLLIEAGQADLLLISWLGVDLLNKGERVYRLLGCELTYHGSPPLPGQTLRYQIQVDDHAELNGIRLFFFHYECYVGDRLLISARGGQAGFFTDAELAETAGVLWDPAAEQPPATGRIDPPAIATDRRRFAADAVRAFAAGQPVDCFGPRWMPTRAHVRTPRISDGRLLLLGEVAEFDPDGGPWKRGYLRADTPVTAEDWFFAGHFTNDPCMPGTLMLDGCLQAMAFYLAAAGFTVNRDGWRFEPVPDQPYQMRCRGQVTPDSRRLSYELFVVELTADPEPTLFADVLCTVDGVRAFHARRVGLRLVPDWPLTHWGELGPPAVQRTGDPVALPALGGLRGHQDAGPVAVREDFAYGYRSLLACAWGRPTEAFGDFYAPFESARRAPRLPGPPYHFMTRVVSVDGPAGSMRVGSVVEAEYDVPDEAWYFEQNGRATMPLAVLMEVGLQPCGWLASYVGCTHAVDTDLLFRNLDGTGTQTAEVSPGVRTIRTRARLKDISQNGSMIIVSFDVDCDADGRPAFSMSTVFGFFPPHAFIDQPGLPVSETERAALAAPAERVVDLTARPDRYCAGGLRLAGPMLLMLDRITGYWPDGGPAGLGRVRAEKDVDAGEWFFKAHFFQDPVQPGSLGIEAMCQVLQWYLIETDAGCGVPNPRFEPMMLERTLTWKYRGQVVPTNRRITVELDVLDVGADDHGRYATGEASLWVDGIRIYRANLGMRVVAGERPQPTGEEVLDPAEQTWLADHCPTWTVPALPMMSMVDRRALAAGPPRGRQVVGVHDVQVRRWVPVPSAVRLRTDVAGSGEELTVTLSAWRQARTAELSRFEPVATGAVCVGRQPAGRPDPWPALADAEEVPDPYQSGMLFHGPRMQYLTALRIGPTGSSATLDAGRGGVPRGLLHQGLLDAVTHAIPHDRLWLWSAEIPRDRVGFPHRLAFLQLHRPLPDTGELRVEARFAGFDERDVLRPMFDLQVSGESGVHLTMRLVDVLLPTGRFGAAEPARRRAFLRDREPVAGLGLSTVDGTTTRLSRSDVEQHDWLPGTVSRAYGLPPGVQGADRLARIAVQDHVGRLAGVHPSAVTVADDLGSAWPSGRPHERYPLAVTSADDEAAVRDLVAGGLPPDPGRREAG